MVERLTPAQAEEVLESQTQEMQELSEQIASTSAQTEAAREELSRLAKEVGHQLLFRIQS